MRSVNPNTLSLWQKFYDSRSIWFMLESSHKMRNLLILVLFSLVPSQSYGEMVEVIDYQEQTLNQLVHSRDTQYFRADGELIIFNLIECMNSIPLIMVLYQQHWNFINCHIQKQSVITQSWEIKTDLYNILNVIFSCIKVHFCLACILALSISGSESVLWNWLSIFFSFIFF